MSATATRVPVSEAMAIAERLISRIEPFAERVQVAGSIRRGLPTVGDIELVCIPKMAPTFDMFDQQAGEVDLLDQHLNDLERTGIVAKRARSDGKTFWGKRAKDLTFEGMSVDLFTPEAARFGLILMIRTGPAAYSHQLVTERGKALVVGFQPNGRPITRMGMLPAHLRVQDGWLTSRVAGIRIPTPEEKDFYDYTRLPYLEPSERR